MDNINILNILKQKEILLKMKLYKNVYFTKIVKDSLDNLYKYLFNSETPDILNNKLSLLNLEYIQLNKDLLNLQDSKKRLEEIIIKEKRIYKKKRTANIDAQLFLTSQNLLEDSIFK